MSKTELERMQKSIEATHSARIQTIAALHNKTNESKLVFDDRQGPTI